MAIIDISERLSITSDNFQVCTLHSLDTSVDTLNPMVLHGILMGVMQEGWIDFYTNSDFNHLESDMTFMAMPEQIFSFAGASDHFDLKVLYVPVEMFRRITPSGVEMLPDESFTDLISSFLPCQCFRTQTESTRDIAQAMDILGRRLESPLDAHNHQLHIALIRSMILMARTGNLVESLPVITNTRQRALAREFFVLLQRDFRQQHEVRYYASKLCVSSKYLSAVIKQFSGFSPQRWITMALSFEAKHLLDSTQLTVNEIADRLVFDTDSTFVRFFRQHVGLTPLAYRRRDR